MARVKRAFQKPKESDVHYKVELRRKSVKKQIRDLERTLRLDLPESTRISGEKRLQELRRTQAQVRRQQTRLADRYKQVKFFERRKVERLIRRAEKELKSASDEDSRAEAADKLQQLNRDLEYIRFFPRTEKYISLFKANADDKAVALREKYREQIRAEVEAGVAVEESEEDYPVAMSEDDFFLRDEADGEADAKDDETKSPENGRNMSLDVKKTSLTTTNKRPQKQTSGPVAEKYQVEAEQSEKEKRKRKRKRPKKK